MPPKSPEAAVASSAHRARRLLNLAAYLEAAVLGLAVLLGAVATAWVATKVLWPAWHLQTLWGLAAAPLVLVAAYLYCRQGKAFFSQSEALVVADTLRRGDAELPARTEAPAIFSTPFDRRVPERSLRLKPTAYLRVLAPALVYLGLAALVPPAPETTSFANEVLALELAPLQESLEDSPLAEELKEELRETLREMAEEKRELSPEQWEALSEVSERVSIAHEQAQREAETLETMVAAVEAALAAEEPAKAEMMSQAGAALMEALQATKALGEPQTLAELAQLAGELKGKAGKSPGKPGEGGKLSDKQLKEKLDALKKKLGECKGKCAGNKSKCEGSGQCSGKGKGKDGDGKPGSGGVNRGRGDAELSYDKKATEFDHTLDAQRIENRDDDETYEMGIVMIRPETAPDLGERGATTTIDGSNVTGGAVQRVRLSPTRQQAVRRYFESGDSTTAAANP